MNKIVIALGLVSCVVGAYASTPLISVYSCPSTQLTGCYDEGIVEVCNGNFDSAGSRAPIQIRGGFLALQDGKVLSRGKPGEGVFCSVGSGPCCDYGNGIFGRPVKS